MNTAYYIAKRLHSSEDQAGRQTSRPAIRMAVMGIAVGIAIMLVSLSVVIGFKAEIRNQVTGFGGHLQVVNFDNNNTYQMKPIQVTDSLLQMLRSVANVRSATPFCTKPGILKTDSAFQGIVVKGREEDEFFSKKLTQGHLPEKEQEVLVSESMSKLLHLGVGEHVYCYFIDEQVRARRYTISGLYDTRFSDYDNLFVIAPTSEVQRLNGFDSIHASGIEIVLENFSKLSETADEVYFLTANRPDEEGNLLYTQTIEDLNPGIFSWLRLLDMNVIVILVLMFAVSAFCMVSGLIILILDNVQLIGTLKALGAENKLLKRTFLYEAGFLTGQGLLWGNLAGIGICLVQHNLHIVPLDPTTYYVSYVPTAIVPAAWLLLNAVTLALILLVLLGPSALVAKISPAKVMHFE